MVKDKSIDWITSNICDSISCDIQSESLTSFITFSWMMCSFMRLAMLQFEKRLQKCIRMGITIFKIFIWGGISSNIRLEITFYGSTRASP